MPNLGFIRWVLLLKGFDIEINDKKRVENLAADHLSRLENLNLEIFTEEEIVDEFPKEHILMLKAKPNDDEPWYADYVNCIVEKIVPPRWTPKKEEGFFWPSIIKDAKDYKMRCDACQISGNISSRSEMPKTIF
nr:reverse transcriptase domain-containing protein [Tanacetum cinerariifolium]